MEQDAPAAGKPHAGDFASLAPLKQRATRNGETFQQFFFINEARLARRCLLLLFYFVHNLDVQTRFALA